MKASRALYWRSVALSGLLLAACASETGLEPLPEEPLTVVVTPASLHLCTGQESEITAQVLGGSDSSDRSVTFATADPAVVAIRERSPDAVTVAGVGSGETLLVATAAADPAVADTAHVTVGFCTSPTPAITINAITVAGTSTPVDSQNVTGRIDVHHEFDAAPAGSTVRIVIGASPRIECPPIVPPRGSGICPVDTAAKDAQGAAVHSNGEQSLTMLMVRPDGVIVASNQRTVVLANPG